ncbi:hypothetical protein chiPu_0023171 [Chiloscyllium punctatum]|uniref:ZP domain-containing protein n=1 Tax=Chiloscyllium punctatum TaxID=137246 RepID=A0A401T8L6_CHIPU|nr:hypothetical protein [Chiloscyllium punctatum]
MLTLSFSLCCSCVNDETFRSYKTNDLRKQRFSFHVFKFEDFPQVYIFCDLILCHSNSSPNRCERGCVPTRRKRELRSMESKVKAAHLSQGPIVFPASSLGVLLFPPPPLILPPSPTPPTAGRDPYKPWP